LLQKKLSMAGGSSSSSWHVSHMTPPRTKLKKLPSPPSLPQIWQVRSSSSESVSGSERASRSRLRRIAIICWAWRHNAFAAKLDILAVFRSHVICSNLCAGVRPVSATNLGAMPLKAFAASELSELWIMRSKESDSI
jgi:hypothetical protein